MQKAIDAAQTAIIAKNLRKTFNGFVAVDNISFNVFAGECVGVLGPNGAGKTTTLRLLMGVTIPDSTDKLEVLGFQVPNQAKTMRYRLGVVPQDNNLDPDFTVRENLIIYANYFGLSEEKLGSYLNELLAFAALEQKANAKIPTLSGGMKRRLILARALINRPQLIILDEPTTGLDPQARQFIWQKLRTLKAQGTTLVLTTHYMEEAHRLCDRILIMDNGTILAEGTPSSLISKYIEPNVVEIHGEEVDNWHQAHRLSPKERIERVGETYFCYCEEEGPLLQELAAWSDLDFSRRPGNLEDVFIKLTGRELRE